MTTQVKVFIPTRDKAIPLLRCKTCKVDIIKAFRADDPTSYLSIDADSFSREPRAHIYTNRHVIHRQAKIKGLKPVKSCPAKICGASDSEHRQVLKRDKIGRAMLYQVCERCGWKSQRLSPAQYNRLCRHSFEEDDLYKVEKVTYYPQDPKVRRTRSRKRLVDLKLPDGFFESENLDVYISTAYHYDENRTIVASAIQHRGDKKAGVIALKVNRKLGLNAVRNGACTLALSEVSKLKSCSRVRIKCSSQKEKAWIEKVSGPEGKSIKNQNLKAVLQQIRKKNINMSIQVSSIGRPKGLWRMVRDLGANAYGAPTN